MNGLLGYPSSGPMNMGNLGQEGLIDKAQFVWNVATGNAAGDLDAQKQKLRRQAREIDSMRRKESDLSKDERGAAARRALLRAEGAYSDARDKVNSAIREHNGLASKISSYTLGAVEPPQVGLAAIQFAPMAAWVGAFVLVFSGVILTAAVAYNVASSAVSGSQSVVGEAADAFRAAGQSVWDVGSSITMLAWTGAALFVGYVAYKELRVRGKFRSAAPTFSAGAPMVLKTVEAA